MVKETNKSNKSNGLDYLGILKTCFTYVRHNKFLWFLGALAGGGAGGLSMPNFGGGSNSNFNFSEKGKPSQTFDTNQVNSAVESWIESNWVLILVIVLAIILIFLVLGILSIICKGGLVQSVSKLSENEKGSFGKGFKYGLHTFWRVLGLSFLLGFVFFLFIFILILPGILMFAILPLFIGYIILAVLLFAIIAVLVGVVYEYALRFIVLKDEKIIASTKKSIDLVKTKIKETALIWLINLGVSIVAGIVLMIGLALVGVVLLLLGILIYLLSHIGGIVYAVVALILFVAVLFIASGVVNSFISAYWTLTFKELTK